MDLKSTRDAYGECLEELGSNESVVVVDADLSGSTRTRRFADKFPERFFNVGVAEQNLIATAAGLAYAGKTAIASSYAIFATGRAWEQIRLAAHDNLDLKIVVTHSGLTNAPDGASHHSLEDIATMRVIPNMKVIVPTDSVETKQAIRKSIEVGGPFYIRLSRVASPVLFESDHEFELGRASTLREGEDLALMSTGNMVSRSLEAAKSLEREGIDARVIALSTIKPMDQKAVIGAAIETGAIVTVEEHSIHGGLGGIVAEIISSEHPAPLEMIGVRDKFGQSARSVEDLYEYYGLTLEAIVDSGKRVLGRKK